MRHGMVDQLSADSQLVLSDYCGRRHLTVTFPFSKKSRKPKTLLLMQVAATTPPFCSCAGSSVFTGMLAQQCLLLRMMMQSSASASYRPLRLSTAALSLRFLH